MLKLSPLDKNIRYTGRVDLSDEKATFCWPGSQLTFRFKGTSVKIEAKNDNFGAGTIIGAVVDGEEKSFDIGWSQDADLTIADGLEDAGHEIVVYKRMEGHYLTISAIILEGEDPKLLPLPEKPHKRIEVYGDSVSAGSVTDCVDYVGKPDPADNRGQYDNAWHAYPQLVAKMLPAEVYDTSQGGIAIFDKTGWFEMPDTKGVESCYKMLRYSSYRPRSEWDFSFKPHVIVFAVGQNDANPDPDVITRPDSRKRWIDKYVEIASDVRERAGGAAVVLALTVLQHAPEWDDALDDIAELLGGEEKRAYHFRYKRCGAATPGHPRISEQTEMAEELTEFLRGLPEDVWQD